MENPPAAFSPAFMPPRLFFSRVPVPLATSIFSPLCTARLLACASSVPLAAAGPSCPTPHANAASPCFVALTALNTSVPADVAPNHIPLTPPTRIPNARETNNPGGEAAEQRRHRHLIPTPPLVVSLLLFGYKSRPELAGSGGRDEEPPCHGPRGAAAGGGHSFR
jgi:hypothetical protein